MNHRYRAFTLVEMMIVLVIITIVASVAVLAIGHVNRKAHLKETVVELTSLLKVAEQYAILQPGEVGIQFKGDHYRFVRYQENAKEPWQEIHRGALSNEHIIPDDIKIDVTQNNEETNKDKPLLLFSRTGEALPFVFNISPRYGRIKFKVVLNKNGQITVNEK